MLDNLGFSKGLAGVVADTTAISQVQGEAGRLIYRGISIETLAAKSTFEECVFFALYGYLPKKDEFDNFVKEMKGYRSLPKYAQDIINSAPTTAYPMAVLQAVIASIGYSELPVNLKHEDENKHEAVHLISAISTAVAHISCVRRGKPVLSPREDLSHAENFLYMLNGNVPDAALARMFDVALILHLDHDFNASTFTARVVGSTEARLALSISAAIGALSGPLHGGANEKVLEMVDEIGSPEKAKDWVYQALSSKKKVMGFGHRVYKTTDPRAKVLRSMLETLVATKSAKEKETYEILKIVHDTMIAELSKKEKDYIWPNVDFWSGALYRLMGIEPADFTPIFAVARVAGWSSHILEMWRDNRIYRPAAKYIGPTDASYVEFADR